MLLASIANCMLVLHCIVSSFKKKVTLEKHKSTKHMKNNYSADKKIWEGQFVFAFNVRPGKEIEAEELRLELREKKNKDNTSNEKHIINDKVEQTNNEKGEFSVEDSFQLEVVTGESGLSSFTGHPFNNFQVISVILSLKKHFFTIKRFHL